MIPEIEGHALAEESRLSVPAPRRVQIFFQVCQMGPKRALRRQTWPKGPIGAKQGQMGSNGADFLRAHIFS